MSKLRFSISFNTLAALAGAFLLAGCASQQQNAHYAPRAEMAPPPPPPAPAPAPAAGYGPSYATFEKDGVKYIKGSMAFPTGKLDSSGLLLEKVVPAEAMVGAPITYDYKVINLSGQPLEKVTVWDRVSSNFRASSASPQPTTMSGGVATWDLGELGPNETKTISVTGTASDEGTITTCAWAAYTPVLCEPIKLVKANLQLVKRLPAEVLVCDPIPLNLTVKNTGSSTLTKVTVTDPLPDGWTSDGKNALSFDAGTLKPGEARDFSATVNAARTGQYHNTAKAVAAEGISAEAMADTVVRQPVLTLACVATDQQFVGRSAEICFTVANTGDAVSDSTVVEAPLPDGATFQSATEGGQLSGGKVTWNVGSLAPGAQKKVCMTFTAGAAMTASFSGSAQGKCATAVRTTCQTRLVGVAGVLLEVVDVADPIEVGKEETYVVEVTNQGAIPLTNLKLTATADDSQDYVSGSGDTAVSADGRNITMATMPTLASKAKATWKIVVKANKADDARFSVKMICDQIRRPVEETESTTQY